jgi:putative ABC transport system permease protein
MLGTRWQKVFADLWRQRVRTLVVALAIAVGVYAVGVVLNTRELVVREYRSDQDGARLASAVLYTYPFEDDLAERIAEMPGVAAAEGRRVVDTRIYTGSGEDRRLVGDLVLAAVPDFDDMQVDALTPLEGAWPPGKREVVLERLAPDYLGVQIGQTIDIELADGTQKVLTVVGTAHDPQALSPNVTNAATGYVTPETMVSLGLGHTYDEMRIRVSEQASDQVHIEAIADQVEDQLERTGRPVLARRVITESIADPFIDTIVLILSSFGVIILLLSGFLVVNAISALISQQVPQIGVMKLIGARRSQVMGLYMVTVLAYGVIAIVLGIPLAVLTSQLLMNMFVGDILNVLIDSLAVPPFIIVIQGAVGLLLPLLAGLAPVIKGTRITTHRALNDVGTQAGSYGRGRVERILSKLKAAFSLQRPTLLAIRNTLRHKGRLVQTLVVLVIGSSLFISVVSVWNSVNATVEEFMRHHQYDVSVRFERPYRIDRLEQVADQLPGVVDVEGWSVATATRLRPDGTESEGMRIYGVPANSPLMAPQVTEGSWLAEDRHNALVVNSDVLDKEPGMVVGTDVILKLDGREAPWHVVGVVPTESQGPAIYVTHDDYAYAARTPGQATRLQVVTERHDAAWQEKMEKRLLAHFEAYGLEVSGTETTQVMRAENRLIFTIVVAFLALMAVLLAAVGGLGLTTTMSINILERVREIGVLRAVGASNGSVRQIVLAEGVAIGALSWAVGVLLSLPISHFMSEQLGLALIKVPLSYEYSLLAAVGWFFVLQAVAVLASLGPARNAVRLTIREVLAYE